MTNWFNSFKGRMTLFFGVSFALVTAGFIYQFENSESHSLVDTRREMLQSLARNVAGTMSSDLEERAREIRLLTLNPVFAKGDWKDGQLRSHLEALKDNFAFYTWIGVADTTGRVRAATGGTLEGQDVSQRPWFSAGMNASFLGDVHEAVLLAKQVKNEHPEEPLRFIDVASPIYGANGQLRGVLGSHADWIWAGKVIQKALRQAKTGNQVEVFIAANHGTGGLLYPYAAIGKVKIPQGGKGGEFSDVVDWDGDTYLVSSTQIASDGQAGLGWQVVVREPVSVALAPVRMMQKRLGIYSAALFLFFLALAFALSRWLSRPLERLTDIAHRIAGGELNVKFPPTEKIIEIDTLSKSLHNMVDELDKRFQENIKQRSEISSGAEQLNLAFESAQMGSYHWDVKTGLVTWSDAYRKLFKLPAYAQASYENFKASVDPQDWEETERKLLAAMEQRKDFEAEFRIHWPDGSPRWILSRGRFFVDGGNTVIRMEGVVTDITERKQIEVELIQYRDSLERMVEKRTNQQTVLESKLKSSLDDKEAILNSDIVGFWITKNRKTVWLNEIAASDLGYTPNELIGEPTNKCYANHESFMQFGAARHKAIAENKLFHTQWQWKHKEGHLCWFDITAVPMPSDPETTIWAAINIDGIKHVENELRTAKTEAEEANHAKSRFLAIMSHEIRTPLNAIIGMSYLLSDTQLDKDQKEEVKAITNSSHSLLALINDILDLSKIEAGEMQLEAYPFALADICQELQHMYSVLATEKGLTLNVKLDERLPKIIQGDGNRLRQMLSNYFSNALKFTEHGSIEFAVREMRRDLSANQVRLRFSVRDSGIGILPDVQKALFEPFKQADSSTSRKFGGTGLGLSIVKQLAERMGGGVGLESEPGKGSTFWLELPFGISKHELQIDDLGAPAIPGPMNQEEKDAVFDMLKGSRVLVVDDSYTNLDVCHRILSMKGVKVTLCESGAEALAALKSAPDGFDAILMDVQMPGLSGIETTRAIRKDLKINDIPVLALSAGATTQEKQEALDSGMNDFLSKPIQPANLFKTLGAYVQMTISRRSLLGERKSDQAWPILAGIDATLSERLAQSDVERFKQQLHAFIEGHAQSVAQIKAWVDDGEHIPAAHLLVKLGEQAGGIGATRLQEASKSLAGALKVNALNDVSMKFDDFADAAGDFF